MQLLLPFLLADGPVTLQQLQEKMPPPELGVLLVHLTEGVRFLNQPVDGPFDKAELVLAFFARRFILLGCIFLHPVDQRLDGAVIALGNKGDPRRTGHHHTYANGCPDIREHRKELKNLDIMHPAPVGPAGIRGSDFRQDGARQRTVGVGAQHQGAVPVPDLQIADAGIGQFHQHPLQIMQADVYHHQPLAPGQQRKLAGDGHHLRRSRILPRQLLVAAHLGKLVQIRHLSHLLNEGPVPEAVHREQHIPAQHGGIRRPVQIDGFDIIVVIGQLVNLLGNLIYGIRLLLILGRSEKLLQQSSGLNLLHQHAIDFLHGMINQLDHMIHIRPVGVNRFPVGQLADQQKGQYDQHGYQGEKNRKIG
ncbi:hypothetical protein D3C75_613970 [compost metagenome]